MGEAAYVPAKQDGYVWFENVRVGTSMFDGLYCFVGGKRVPLHVMILHPDCKLACPGDVGHLGVPVWWAIARGLLPG